jgi:hypothetical protein
LPTLEPEVENPSDQPDVQQVSPESQVLQESPQPQIPAVPIPQDQLQMPAAQSLLYQLLNHQRGQSQKFHLVIVPDDDHPTCITCDTVEELLEHIRPYLDTNTSLFPFMGNPMRISKGPNRYLDTPFGALPLFVLPPTDELEFESDGFVGVPKKELKPPAAEDDDEDDEEDEEAQEERTGTPAPPAIPAPEPQDTETPVFPPQD